MRIQIDKKLRVILIIIVMTLISISSFLLLKQLDSPKYEEEAISVYSYNNKASVDYKVYLKPNNIYEEVFLKEGEVYLTEFTDYIEANFKYEFKGERDAHLKGNYEVMLKVQGFTYGEEEEIKSIWEKDYQVVRSKQFDIKNKVKAIEQEVKLNLEPYNDLVTQIKDTSKINSQAMLTLLMNINIEGETDQGSIAETISPNIIIPLDVGMFEITGNTDIDEPGAIEETIQIPVKSKQIIVYAMIIGVLVLVLLILIFVVKVDPNNQSHKKALKKIFRKHGDRLVALNSEMSIKDENISYVKSIDDLVRMADEIGQPILYKYSEDYKDINSFYIANEKYIYILDLG